MRYVAGSRAAAGPRPSYISAAGDSWNLVRVRPAASSAVMTSLGGQMKAANVGAAGLSRAPTGRLALSTVASGVVRAK